MRGASEETVLHTNTRVEDYRALAPPKPAKG